MTSNSGQTIVVSLGAVAYGMAVAFHNRLTQDAANYGQVAFLPLLEEMPDDPPLPAIPVGLRANADLAPLTGRLLPGFSTETDANALFSRLAATDRPRGQIAMAQHQATLRQRLRQAQQTIAAQAQSAPATGAQRLTVFVLLSLADAFMSGLLPDLAYLIRGELARGAPDTLHITIHLVLALPGFDGETRPGPLLSHNPDADSQRRMDWNNASAAACLREIDYYYGDPQRPAAYRRAFDAAFTVDMKSSPLGDEGRIILIEPTNERGHPLSNVDALASMTGDWLFDVVCGGLFSLLVSSSPAAGAYSSIGHAGLMIPMPLWQRRASLRLQADLLGRLQATSRDGGRPPAISTVLAEVGLSDPRLGGATNDGGLEGPTNGDYDATLRKRYTREMQRLANETRSGYTRWLVGLLHGPAESSPVTRLDEYTHKLLDTPEEGLPATFSLLTALHQHVQQMIAPGAAGTGPKLAALKQARRQWLTRRQVVSGPGRSPFFWSAVLLLLALGSAAAGGRLLARTAPLVATVAAAAAVLGLAAILAYEFLLRERSGEALKRAFKELLAAHKQQERNEAMRELFQALLPFIRRRQADLHELARRLDEQRSRILTTLRDEFGDDDAALVRAPHRTAISLLTPSLIALAESQSSLADLDKHHRDFLNDNRQWLSRWLAVPPAATRDNAANAAIARLAAELADYADRQAATALRGVTLAWTLERTLPGSLPRYESLVVMSAPYCRYMPPGNSQEPPQRVIMAPGDLRIDRLFGHDDAAPIAAAGGPDTSQPGNHLSNFASRHEGLIAYESPSPYRLTLASARHGLSLSALPTFVGRLDAAYQHYVRDERTAALLHSLPGRLALPDPDMATWPTRLGELTTAQLYAVGRATNDLRVKPDGAIWLGLERELAGTQREAVLRLNRPDDDARDVLLGPLGDSELMANLVEKLQTLAKGGDGQSDAWLRAVAQQTADVMQARRSA